MKRKTIQLLNGNVVEYDRSYYLDLRANELSTALWMMKAYKRNLHMTGYKECANMCLNMAKIYQIKANEVETVF